MLIYNSTILVGRDGGTLMVYSKKKDIWEISKMRSDNAKKMWNERKVVKRVLKPRRRSRLWYYITYIYLPVGFLIFMPAFIYLDQKIVGFIATLWAAGAIGLMWLDDKLGGR